MIKKTMKKYSRSMFDKSKSFVSFYFFGFIKT